MKTIKDTSGSSFRFGTDQDRQNVHRRFGLIQDADVNANVNTTIYNGNIQHPPYQIRLTIVHRSTSSSFHFFPFFPPPVPPPPPSLGLAIEAVLFKVPLFPLPGRGVGYPSPGSIYEVREGWISRSSPLDRYSDVCLLYACQSVV